MAELKDTSTPLGIARSVQELLGYYLELLLAQKGKDEEIATLGVLRQHVRLSSLWQMFKDCDAIWVNQSQPSVPADAKLNTKPRMDKPQEKAVMNVIGGKT